MPSIANWRLLAVSSIHGFDRSFPSRREATTTISGFRRPQNSTAKSACGSVKPIDRRSNCRRSQPNPKSFRRQVLLMPISLCAGTSLRMLLCLGLATIPLMHRIGISLPSLPAIDATLNATSALLLTLGYFFIRRERIQAHKFCMLSAFATSSLFLVCYIWYHAHHGVTRFPGQGAVCDLYLALLGSRTSLAVVIVPLILTTPYWAWRGRFERHKKIARWTRPLWFYVSVTGVVVCWMLYHVYAQVAAR